LGRVDENPLLPVRRGERPALLYAQRLEHAHHHPVAVMDRLLLNDLGQSFPIGEAAWLFAAPRADPLVKRGVSGPGCLAG
jgi:hypothetical protein